MPDDETFEPKLGRIRDTGGKGARRYLGRVIAATHLARGGRARGSESGFSGSRIGRAAGVGAVLAARSRSGSASARRVIVKASIVKLGGKGVGAAAAHLRYLQRDGTTREGQPGELYDATSDRADGKAFHEQLASDRHQFRFIVSAEDGAEYDDLKPLTRRLMARAEEDLGTKLDWVAVDHFNTGHPHTHILVRGVDERGQDLVIARDYLTRGFRERAVELVDLDLGPPTAREVEARFSREIDQERFTSIDRRLLREVDEQGVVTAVAANPLEQSALAGRLRKLERMGLAEPVGGGRFVLAAGLGETLTGMGERDDIIRTMQREFSARAIDRNLSDQIIYHPRSNDARPLLGRVLARGLSDEHADRHYLIVEALDGRAHYVDIGAGAGAEAIGEQAIVRIDPLKPAVRASDRTVAAIAAANGGRYDIDAHLRHDPAATEGFAETHVRRLEAMRRAGVPLVRFAAGEWTIGDDHLAHVERYEAARLRDRPVAVSMASPVDLDVMERSYVATWLDRELTSETPSALRDAGFGGEVRAALDSRRQWLLAQGFAEDVAGQTNYPPDMLARLQQREIRAVAGSLATEMSKPFAEALEGGRVNGVVRQTLDLKSGRFTVIERAHDFTLVPWRSTLERASGQTVSGIMRETGTSWTIGRGRQGPVIG